MDPTRFELERIYTARDLQELAERYDLMSANYDESIQEEWGWTPPEFTAKVFARYVATGSKVLDAGAGTGLAGQALARRSYRNLTGIDISEGMLAKAREKEVYQKLYQMELGKPLVFPDRSFDAVIAVGVFTIGHAPADALDEVTRITRPGGYIVYTLRPDWHDSGGFKEKHAALEALGKWKLLERTEPFVPLPKREPDVFFEVWVFEVV